MYSNTVTIFNYYESSTAAVWYPHVLFGVHLETDRGQILKKYGPDSTDKAELHIAYTEKDGQKIITDAAGKGLIWLPPKAWAKQVNDELSDSITFNPATDFFWKGEWTGENPVNDEDYSDRLSEGFYAYMNRENDFVFLITTAGGPYTVIPHFEILGA
ncbi:MAG TPA: hypothetical protein H9955_02845 [Candidatus Mediterraneibacter cottocaccae]|nr:hypothetical protein [Candidatus Mediterraneibacter cottocaccae]